MKKSKESEDSNDDPPGKNRLNNQHLGFNYVEVNLDSSNTSQNENDMTFDHASFTNIFKELENAVYDNTFLT